MRTVRSRTFVELGALLLVSAVVLIGCGGSGEDGRRESEDRGIRGFSASERYPYETVGDRRAFTDGFVTVEATAERLGAVEGPNEDEGYVPRHVTVEVIERLWAREGIEIPDSFETETGIAVSDGKEYYLVGDGGTAVEAGKRYLMGIVLQADGTFEATVSAATLPLDGDNVLPPGGSDPTKRAAPVPVDEYVQGIVEAQPVVPDDVGDTEERLVAWQQQQP
jgi:hypothetical protein